MPPRYFLPRTEKNLASAPITHLVDRFWWKGAEYLLVTDLVGQLLKIPADPSALPPSVAEELANAKLQGPARHLIAETLCWMEVSGLEQAAEVEGLNDPLQLDGVLYEETGTKIEGQLTLTRGDLLRGFLEELPQGMPVQTASGKAGRCLHLWLPAEREEVLATGKGAVLAIPMVPAELAPLDRANESLCMELLFGVLKALQEDMRKMGVQHPLTNMLLPVPDLAALLERWGEEGFLREGSVAVRRPKGTGFLGSLASALAPAQTRKIPAEATLATLTDLARQALSVLPADGRQARLRQLVGGAGVASPRIPAASASFSEPPPERIVPPAPSFRRNDRQDWLSDFEGSGPAPAKAAPAKAAAAPKRKTPLNPPVSGRPSWMDDFE